jgi:hypothetical protein
VTVVPSPSLRRLRDADAKALLAAFESDADLARQGTVLIRYLRSIR